MVNRSEIESLLREVAPTPLVVSSPLHLPQGEVREYTFGIVEKNDGTCELYIRIKGKWVKVSTT